MDLLFPAACAHCGRPDTLMCVDCIKMFTDKQISRQICPGCGRHSPHGRTHSECRPLTPLDGMLHALNYQEPGVRKLIQWLKYQNVSAAAQPCAVAVSVMLELFWPEIYKNTPNQAVRLVPIPLHPKRLRWRGYNQAALVANQISQGLRWPVQTNLLRKTKPTSPQAQLNKQDRLRNAQNSFQLGQAIEAHSIYILVDDVATTRATLNDAALQLKTAQAASVWAVTVAFEP